ncbi:MAG: GxxExxY protein [Candidatus Marinimicrobia bacterium]|nr:GxxExxY protein [Candidatus Neomarinimicrobiota bacterium]MCH7764910.1 GxxExxY protein [Candidatus Neomarinimicrobiota bacterium]
MNTKIIYKELSYQIIGIAMEVHSKLGPGFLEKVNENALILLFKKNGIKTKTQVPIKVTFEEEVIGNYIADILADGKIILELKSAESIGNSHKAQALNYLKVTGLRLAIILNFGKDKLEYYRVVN